MRVFGLVWMLGLCCVGWADGSYLTIECLCVVEDRQTDTMVRGGSSGGGQSSLGYLFGADAGPAKPAAKAHAPEPHHPAPEQRPAGLARNIAAEEKAAGAPPPPAAAPTAKAEDNGTSLDMGANKMGRNSNNYHRADGQNTGNFITVSAPEFGIFLILWFLSKSGLLPS